MSELPKTYNPTDHEETLYQRWEESGAFQPSDNAKETFTIIMPPPNANGSLHIGHALFVTLEDLMIRHQRMLGKATLWVPGADHAGFETQVVFEKKLEKEGKSRFDLTRAELYAAIEKFTLDSKTSMYHQLRRLGASCDWSRELFTLDPKIIKIVYRTFKQLADDGLIYRAERPVHWCPKHQTTLSDLEVSYEDRIDQLSTIRYGPELMVATTRPETIFADVAVAVHPQGRWKHLIGQRVPVPMTTRDVPVIGDEFVDQEFGTGAVKITPAHDPTDFAIGQKHGLPILTVIDTRGRLIIAANLEIIPELQTIHGVKITDARSQIIKYLENHGLLEKNEPLTHAVGVCYKCHNLIEPQILTQWYVAMTKTSPSRGKSLQELGLAAVETGEVKFITDWYTKIYKHWLNNLRDWNISRQIVWGIRIPAWYCQTQAACPPVITAGETPLSCPECGGTKLHQETDVFDTWFSSGQWPFAVLEANQPADLTRFYPTSVMETASDILFFWVARMIMLGKYVHQKTPFRAIYLHGLVRDKDRQKMSKSKGNVIDPLGIADQYGVDAVRMALIFGVGDGTDSSISEEKIRGMRNFANKIWNIGRFIQMNLPNDHQMDLSANDSHPKIKPVTDADKEILKQTNEIITLVTRCYQKYRFHIAAEMIYDFIWHSLADVYLETAKTQLADKKTAASTIALLIHIYQISLKLLHPMMPFVTEALWQNLGDIENEPLLMTARWPTEKAKFKNV